MEDKYIVDLYWERNEKAITETATKYGRYCYSIAFNILSDAEDAKECVNDAYLNTWDSIPPHKPSNLATFLGKVTRFISLKKWRDKRTQKRGGGKEIDYESRFDLKYLVAVDRDLLSPVDGVTVTNIGFIDSKLHVQLYFENILSYDNHGYIEMRDKDGNQAKSYNFSFWDDKKVGSYEEIIYDISPEDIESYKAFGYFVTCKSLTKGHWQVTFPLKNIK